MTDLALFGPVELRVDVNGVDRALVAESWTYPNATREFLEVAESTARTLRASAPSRNLYEGTLVVNARLTGLGPES
jgi:hypothetical protein